MARTLQRRERVLAALVEQGVPSGIADVWRAIRVYTTPETVARDLRWLVREGLARERPGRRPLFDATPLGRKVGRELDP